MSTSNIEINDLAGIVQRKRTGECMQDRWCDHKTVTEVLLGAWIPTAENWNAQVSHVEKMTGNHARSKSKENLDASDPPNGCYKLYQESQLLVMTYPIALGG